MKTFNLTYNNRPLLKAGYTYYPSKNLGPLNTWTIPSTTTDVVSYSSENTIRLKGKGGHYEICYKAFSVEKTGTYTISYDYNLPTVNFYGTNAEHMYFGIFITTNQPPGGDMATWSAYSTGNCNGYAICGPSSQYNTPGEGHVEYNYNLTAGTTYYLWISMMNLADGVETFLTFTNLKWIDTEAVVIPDYKAKTNIYDLEILTAEHGTCVANKYSGFTDNLVSVTATPDEGWYHIGYDITGSVMTGDSFKFLNNDVNLEPIFLDTEGYPITYLADEHVSLTGDPIYIPGSEGITLDSGYDTYYRISGYDITGGSIVDGKLVPTGPCTIKAVEKINYFTARGNFNLYGAGQYILEKNASRAARSYAHYTGGENVPTAYYNVSLTSNDGGSNSVKASGWNPASNISGYYFSGQTIAKTFVERVSTNVQCSLQVGSTNFGNKYNRTYGGETATINNTGTTTTIGKVSRYLTIGSTTSRHYMNDIMGISTNTWTATGIAP